ncbi:MAG: DUF4019 domain-containing protein, partial [Victivallales bacterium]|nr:DUF4019 domain-containing protein [Victivallales bacterium]
SLVFLRGITAATLTELDNEFMTILREVSKVFKFKYLPEILITKAVASPLTMGISRVSVFIPENLYGNMTEDEFRSILFHEFAHIHHKDHLFSILNKFIIGLNWWNPLVYHISTEQNMAREDVCDDYAIKGIKSAEVYSTCLVNLAERICLISNLPATAGMAGRKSSLERRIKSIMSKERKMFSKTKKSVKLATVILCALVISLIGGINVSCAEATNSTVGKKESRQNSKSETAAIKAAKSWLALLDAGRFQESWEQAAQVFKKAITKEQWAKAMAGLKKAFGKNISRKLKSRRYYTSLPGAPDGKYVVIQFKSSFENKKSAIETITPILDEDGKWRVSGYFIK